MDAIKAIWAAPFEEPVLPKLTQQQRFDLDVARVVQYAKDSKGDFQSVLTLSPRGRPDLDHMVELEKLVILLLDFGKL